ncbi:MAG: hypothetical protein RLY85_473 [Bacteroidota bacterium]|jgi:hypothetical protein
MKEWIKPEMDLLEISKTAGVCQSTIPGKVQGLGDGDFPDDCSVPTS